jgi:hypothetical protein
MPLEWVLSEAGGDEVGDNHLLSSLQDERASGAVSGCDIPAVDAVVAE